MNRRQVSFRVDLRALPRIVTAATLLAATPVVAATSYVHAGHLIDVIQGRVLADQLVKIVDG